MTVSKKETKKRQMTLTKKKLDTDKIYKLLLLFVSLLINVIYGKKQYDKLKEAYSELRKVIPKEQKGILQKLEDLLKLGKTSNKTDLFKIVLTMITIIDTVTRIYSKLIIVYKKQEPDILTLKKTVIDDIVRSVSNPLLAITLQIASSKIN
ncbi:MAG TPA: hypothetical protein V6C58_14170 [Allocoleopsis sp.]